MTPHQRIGGEDSDILVVDAADGRPLTGLDKHQANPQEERLHQPKHDAQAPGLLAQVRKNLESFCRLPLSSDESQRVRGHVSHLGASWQKLGLLGLFCGR